MSRIHPTQNSVAPPEAWEAGQPSPGPQPADVVVTLPGDKPKALTTEEYIPVRIARERIKVVLAEMAEMKAKHLTVINELEEHYSRMKAQAQEKVTEYVRTLQREHETELKRLQAFYSEKFNSVEQDARQSSKQQIDERESALRKMQESLEQERALLQKETQDAKTESAAVKSNLEELKSYFQQQTHASEVNQSQLEQKITSLEKALEDKEKQMLSITQSKNQDTQSLRQELENAVSQYTELQTQFEQERIQTQQTHQIEIEQIRNQLQVEKDTEISALQAQIQNQSAASSAAIQQTHEAEKAQLIEQIQSSQQRIAQLEKEVADALKKVAEVEAEKSLLEAEVAQCKETIAKTSQEGHETVTKTQQEWSAKVEQKDNEIAELQKLVQNKELQGATELREALEVERSQRKEIEEHLTQAKQQLAEAGASSANAAAKAEGDWKQKYEQLAQEKKNEIEVLTLRLTNAEQAMLEEGKSSHDLATRRMSQMQLLEKQLHDKDQELQNITKRLTADLDKANYNLKEAEDERDQVIEQLRNSNENHPLVLELQERTKEVRDLERKKKELEEERDREAAAAAVRIAELERQVDTILVEFEQAKQTISQAAEEQNQKLSTAERERLALQRELHKAISTLGVHSKEVENLRNELETKENEVDDIRTQADSLQRQANELDQAHQQRIQKLELEIAARDKALTQAHHKVSEDLQQNTRDLERAQRETSELTKNVVSSTQDADIANKLKENDAKLHQAQHTRAVLDVQADKVNHQKERQRAGKVVSTLKTKVTAKKDEDSRTAELAQKNEKISLLAEEIKQQKEFIKTLEDQCRLAQAAASEEAIKKEVDKAVKEVEVKLNKVTEKYEKYKKEYQETKAKGMQFEAENIRLSSELSALEARVADMDKIAADVSRYRDENIKLEKESTQAKAFAKECETKWREEVVLRKKYFNEILDLKGKIRVLVRCRPQNSIEKSKNSEIVTVFPDEYSVKIPSKENKEFTFDRCYSPTSTQEMVWEDSKFFAQSAVDGFNCCIFAYGQTGSGKTFTMEGNEQMPGLTPRFIREIYSLLNGMNANYEWKLSCYMMELYNDNLWDLLYVAGGKKERPALDIKLDKDKNIVSVANAVIQPCATAEELRAVYLRGCSNRHTRATGMNDASSRSHLIFSILIETKQRTTGKVATGKLSLVDLAGSERLDKTGIKDPEGMKEAKSINKSLTALGNVINALVTDPEGHIPYRDNKLTQLMRDSLGGNAKTMMIAAISPASYNVEETCNTMTYASRAKLITNDAQKSVDSKEVAKLKEKIAQLKKGLVVEDEVILTTEEPPPSAAGEDD